MSQFWQKKQPMLQPAVPIERICRSGKEVVEWLFLDGIDSYGSGPAIAKLHEPVLLILADETETVLTIADVAVSRAEVAVQTAIGHGLPPTGFVDR